MQDSADGFLAKLPGALRNITEACWAEWPIMRSGAQEFLSSNLHMVMVHALLEGGYQAVIQEVI